jgi:DNA-binding XRE family transcriptional regulator
MNHRSFAELRAKMSPRRRARNKAAAEKMLAEIVLAEMREHSGMTQRQLAAALGISQPTLAQMEKQDDMRLSTLRRLVETLGGQLEIIAHLPCGDFRIEHLKEAS